MIQHQAAQGVPALVEPRAGRGALRLPAAVIVTLLALAVVAINPVGYTGGGSDDWHYLKAAECWAASGPCLPTDHWSARWPLVAPVAAVIAILGETRTTLMIVPFLYALAAALLLRAIAERLFDAPTAMVAAALLLITPVFTTNMVALNIDIVELCFIMAALLAWLRAMDGRIGSALLAGAMLGVALQARETGIVYLAVFGLWFLRLQPAQRRTMLWAGPGFAATIAVPMLAHGWAAGDPLLRYRLALAHTTIPSDQLAAGVDTSRSALFNPDFIGGWIPANGIDLHWTLNPIVNLLTHPQIGSLLIIILLLGALHIARPVTMRGSRHRAAWLVGGAAMAGLLLAYALAVDPKPRMFMPLLCALAVAAALLAVATWRSGRRLLVAALGAAAILQAVPVILHTTPINGAEAAAAAWLAQVREPVTVGETTRRHLALVPGARDLPADDRPGSLRLELGWGGCAHRAGPHQVERAYALRRDYPRSVAWAQAEPQPTAPDGDWLCLFRRTAAP